MKEKRQKSSLKKKILVASMTLLGAALLLCSTVGVLTLYFQTSQDLSMLLEDRRDLSAESAQSGIANVTSFLSSHASDYDDKYARYENSGDNADVNEQHHKRTAEVVARVDAHNDRPAGGIGEASCTGAVPYAVAGALTYPIPQRTALSGSRRFPRPGTSSRQRWIPRSSAIYLRRPTARRQF